MKAFTGFLFKTTAGKAVLVSTVIALFILPIIATDLYGNFDYAGYGLDEIDKEEKPKKRGDGPLLHPVTGEPAGPDSEMSVDPATGEIVDEFGLILRFAESENGCINCHYNSEKSEQVILNWDKGIHSSKKVTCVKCHGGSENSKNVKEAKNEATAFKLVGTSLLKIKGKELHDKAFEYCGQCHGTIFRDWEAGIHGKRTGFWNGEKIYLVCIACHDPHDPKFKKLKPKPPPVKPDDITLDAYLSGKKAKDAGKKKNE